MRGATLKGRLLVALPILRDENFDRTIVFVIEHTDEGAMGVVLNRPSPIDIAELLPDWAELAAPPTSLFIGGPVGANVAVGLGQAADTLVAVDLETDPAANDVAVAQVRVFVGYAGWGSGQLEDEIEAGAWLVVDAEPADVLTDAPDDLWSDVLRRQEGRLGALASFPPDPTLN